MLFNDRLRYISISAVYTSSKDRQKLERSLVKMSGLCIHLDHSKLNPNRHRYYLRHSVLIFITILTLKCSKAAVLAILLRLDVSFFHTSRVVTSEMRPAMQTALIENILRVHILAILIFKRYSF